MSDTLEQQNPSFALNDFDEVKLYTSDESIVRDLLLLLFGKPGFYPSQPGLGMYIQQYLYEFEDGIDTNAIKVEMAMQCSEFLPLVESGDIDVQVDHWNGRPLLVFILPTIHNTSDAQLVLGVTVLENGEIQFNFVINDKEQEI